MIWLAPSPDHRGQSASVLRTWTWSYDWKDLNLVSSKSKSKSDNPHKLNRSEQVILLRLRTGQIRLNEHLHSKFKVVEPDMCPCNEDIMTAEHLLQHSQLHDASGQDMRPEPMPLWDKLYGNLEELRRKATFTRATGISIQHTAKEEKKKKRKKLPTHPLVNLLSFYT